MNHFESSNLDKIFYLNPSKNHLIGSRESTVLEFKENFSFANLADYAKVMASFANKDGGYIVFGLEDNPRKIVGIDRNTFDTIDQAKLTEGLNDIFQPAMEWDIAVHDWNGFSFGIIYVFKTVQKPIIARKNYGSEIKEGEIYYRYRARSEKIKYSELRHLLDEQKELTNEAWRKVIEKASSIDPRNVAMLDTITGELTGDGGTVVIDESLISKLKFIRDGDFNQKDGAPTLKLIGDLQAVPVAAVKSKKVLIGEDIYKFRASQVAKEVQSGIAKNFSIQLHTKAWKMYESRPKEKNSGFKNEFSELKQAENDYRYSQAWIDFLINKLKTDQEYQKLLDFKI